MIRVLSFLGVSAGVICLLVVITYVARDDGHSSPKPLPGSCDDLADEVISASEAQQEYRPRQRYPYSEILEMDNIRRAGGILGYSIECLAEARWGNGSDAPVLFAAERLDREPWDGEEAHYHVYYEGLTPDCAEMMRDIGSNAETSLMRDEESSPTYWSNLETSPLIPMTVSSFLDDYESCSRLANLKLSSFAYSIRSRVVGVKSDPDNSSNPDDSWIALRDRSNQAKAYLSPEEVLNIGVRDIVKLACGYSHRSPTRGYGDAFALYLSHCRVLKVVK